MLSNDIDTYTDIPIQRDSIFITFHTFSKSLFSFDLRFEYTWMRVSVVAFSVTFLKMSFGSEVDVRVNIGILHFFTACCIKCISFAEPVPSVFPAQNEEHILFAFVFK